MSRKDQPNVLSAFTEPQNLQVQNVCSMPCSPQTLQAQAAVGTGREASAALQGERLIDEPARRTRPG